MSAGSAPAAELPPALEEATEGQPAARAALAAALAAGPSHAYLFAGPPGTGKRSAARAFTAELLAEGAPDPDDARRRALADPSPHPDLVWLAPTGTQHLVDEVRERVIGAAVMRPFEGERRVFVIEAAEAMADEAQNALLKTLEEPAAFAHILLISSEPSGLLETVRSRCQPVRFVALPPAAAERRLADRFPDAERPEVAAVARLAGGDVSLAALLLSEEGRELRARAEECARAAGKGELEEAPWRALLAAAEAAGERAGAEARERATALVAAFGAGGSRRGRGVREAEEAAKRASRRARTRALDLGLALIAAWFRDLAAVGEGAPELVLASDRSPQLRAAASGTDPGRARQAAELAMDARRRLQVNVSEELALEAMLYRAESLLT